MTFILKYRNSSGENGVKPLHNNHSKTKRKKILILIFFILLYFIPPEKNVIHRESFVLNHWLNHTNGLSVIFFRGKEKKLRGFAKSANFLAFHRAEKGFFFLVPLNIGTF